MEILNFDKMSGRKRKKLACLANRALLKEAKK